ncbi:tail completion protein gp17 [Paenibacillus sp. MMO-58]|uniref:tail completion protein gp17 n=1 Tax=Paenibacillus sp. MMO-58 TaxID=3081290 RepID=UPI003019F556
MTFEEALTAELSAVPELADKIYPLDATNAPKAPYVVYESSYGVPTKSMNGYIGGKNVPVELNIICPTYGSMKQVTAAVIAVLESFEQRQIGSDGPYIQELTYETPVELYESAPKLHRCVIEFQVYY